MENEEINQILDEIESDDVSDAVKPIPEDGGLIAYRKYLWALFFIEGRLRHLQDYKERVNQDIDNKIQKEKNLINNIRQQIEMALEVDPIAEKVKTGGRKIVLPDIATVSVSKITDKVIIEDADKVLEELGEEFGKVKVTLDTTKAREYLETQTELPKGARKEKSRTLSIRFNK